MGSARVSPGSAANARAAHLHGGLEHDAKRAVADDAALILGAEVQRKARRAARGRAEGARAGPKKNEKWRAFLGAERERRERVAGGAATATAATHDPAAPDGATLALAPEGASAERRAGAGGSMRAAVAAAAATAAEAASLDIGPAAAVQRGPRQCREIRGVDR